MNLVALGLELADVAAQVTAVPTVQLDLARMVTGVVATAFAMLCAVVVYFLKGILDEFRAMRRNVQSVMHVLFDTDGTGGMVDDLRRTRELQIKHDRLLVALATKAGIPLDLSGDVP